MRNYARPMFQQRHYEAVAEILKETRPGSRGFTMQYEQWEKTCRGFIAMFRADNYKFIPDRFRNACGLES